MYPPIEIPLRDTYEVVVVPIDQLPECQELLEIMRREHSQLNTWVNVAFAYYKQKKTDDFIRLLEAARAECKIGHRGSKKDQVRACEMLAAHYIQEANREQSKDKKREHFMKATNLYTISTVLWLRES